MRKKELRKMKVIKTTLSACALFARIDKEREGADAARNEVLRRRASPPPHPLVRQLRPAEIVAKPINPLDTKWVYGL